VSRKRNRRIGDARRPTPDTRRRLIVLEPFLLRALLFGLGLAAVAAPLGCFVVWRRMAYYGEAIAQAALIGVALAFALSLDVTSGVLIVTLAVSGLLVLLSRQQVVPLDSLLGLIAHAALAAGVICASLASGRQPDLMGFLFGDILAITDADLYWLFVGGAGAMVALLAVWRPLLSLSVHEDIAAAEGTAADRVKLVLVVVLALVVAIAIKIVGALLTIAFLIMPAAAARPLARTPEQMAVIAGALGMVAVAAGLALSLAWDTPAGPSIVLVLAGLFAASILPSVLRR
jgi:zinc transport system permease protein